MSEELGLGRIISEGREVHRDAIHVAVAPVVAGQDLDRGTRVGFADKEKTIVQKVNNGGVGIVDPFLTTVVKKGQRFWLYLFPGTVTGMRHHWSHPDFPSEHARSGGVSSSVKAESEVWLKRFSEDNSIGYRDLLDGLENGDVCFGNDTPDEIHSDYGKNELFQHAQNVLGKVFTEDQRENVSFRCAC